MSGQHVRVTLEGVNLGIEDGQVLRLRTGGDGPLVLISKAWPGVTVEDVTPERQWTDGDVVQDTGTGSRTPGTVWTRVGGKWVSATNDSKAVQDHHQTRDVAEGHAVALRYQAGE